MLIKFLIYYTVILLKTADKYEMQASECRRYVENKKANIKRTPGKNTSISNLEREGCPVSHPASQTFIG
jgi:hypothetical protein